MKDYQKKQDDKDARITRLSLLKIAAIALQKHRAIMPEDVIEFAKGLEGYAYGKQEDEKSNEEITEDVPF